MPTTDELEARLAALEARLYPPTALAANPPVTIGELVDVPAPGSPIVSPWPQETTRRIAHRFATVAERESKYPAAGAGAGALAWVTAEGLMYYSDGAAWRILRAPRLMNVVSGSGTVAPAGQLKVGSLAIGAVGAGVYLFGQAVYGSSAAAIKANLRFTLAVTAVNSLLDVVWRQPLDGAGVAEGTVQGLVIVNVPANATLSCFLMNTGTANLATFGDPTLVVPVAVGPFGAP